MIHWLIVGRVTFDTLIIQKMWIFLLGVVVERV